MDTPYQDYILAENPKPDSVSHEAIFGEDNSNRQMGGYVESLANISIDMTGSGYFAWIDETSRVYGNSIVPCGARVIRSTVADSTILANNGNAYVVDSTVKNSTVSEVHESVVADSTCTREVLRSQYIVYHIADVLSSFFGTIAGVGLGVGIFMTIVDRYGEMIDENDLPSIRRMNKVLLTVGAIALLLTVGCRFALYMYAPDIVMLDGLRK